jgi:hypothetical protein
MIKTSQVARLVLLATITLAVGASPAFAATWVTFTPTSVSCGDNGVCYAEFTTAVVPSACQDLAENDRGAWSSTTNAGQAMTQVVMEAFVSGGSVRVLQSTTTCLEEAGTGKRYASLHVVRIL